MAENLIGSCAKDIVKCMFEEKTASKIDLMINDLANNVLNKL